MLKSLCLIVGSLAALSLITACSFSGLQSSASEQSSEQSLNNVRCNSIENPAQLFYESSGFQLPANSQILLACDDHGGFHWDGEYYIAFNTAAEDAAAFLRTSPWGTAWKQGPIPQEISSRTALSRWNLSAFNSANIWYLFENSNPNIPFHNGRLLVIDLEKNQVLFSKWDF